MNRKEIDLNTYKRKGMLDVFSKKLLPIFSTTSLVDITHFKAFIKEKDLRFFVSMSYVLSAVVNDIPAFKHRIINGKLYEYDQIDTGYTVLLPDNEFSFCATEFTSDFTTYYDNALRSIEHVMNHKDASDDDKNHMFYISSIPWFSFTSFTHPYDPENGSIPIITLGKYFEENGRLKLPIGIQVHHGVMDGFHVGQFYEQLQRKLHSSDIALYLL